MKLLDQVRQLAPYALMARLMYGAGLRVMECCQLRVKDVDVPRGQLSVREGKGDKDRVVPLPERTRERLRARIEVVKRLHREDLAAGHGARRQRRQSPLNRL